MTPSLQKARLFCPSCWHESSPDGDWQRDPREDGLHLVCPTCDSTVTVRPAHEGRVRAPAN